MKFRNYGIAITGETPLLLHNDDFMYAEGLKKWRTEPGNKGKSTPGDDRTPAWTWLGCLYHNQGRLTIPADNIMTLLREGGKQCPTGKGMKTFKSQTQSGLLVNESDWDIIVGGKTIQYAPLKALMGETDYEKHEAMAQSCGFELFAKRAKIGTAKHIRVRPRFNEWALNGSITVTDETITTEILNNILTFAGAYTGLCDWRPSSALKSPGPFGKFTVKMKEL